jgi:hypothetical protein
MATRIGQPRLLLFGKLGLLLIICAAASVDHQRFVDVRVLGVFCAPGKQVQYYHHSTCPILARDIPS